MIATNTWQAYNLHDADGEGWGDSWYVSEAIPGVDLTRPYLDFGLPFRFRDWDLTFIAWANRTGKRVDYLSDDDLDAVGSGDELRRAYDLVVFPGHEEYVTGHAYDVVERYRDLGGNLLFLSANNFYRRVRRDGRRLVREEFWRALGRPESALVGVQYVGSDQGQRQGPYVVTGAEALPWLYAGTGLVNGSTFGRYGIEIDSALAPLSARSAGGGPDRRPDGAWPLGGDDVLRAPVGRAVFAAGALNFGASIDDPVVTRLVENVWARLAPNPSEG